MNHFNSITYCKLNVSITINQKVFNLEPNNQNVSSFFHHVDMKVSNSAAHVLRFLGIFWVVLCVRIIFVNFPKSETSFSNYSDTAGPHQDGSLSLLCPGSITAGHCWLLFKKNSCNHKYVSNGHCSNIFKFVQMAS